MNLPRPEYPRPERVRQRWLNLNGEWEFDFDDDDRGLQEGWQAGQTLRRRIIVPFSFESALSGVDDRKAHPVVWYRRSVDIPADFLSQRLLLHVGACDFETTVWINSAFSGAHRGGYSPQQYEIQSLARPGRNEIVLRVVDRPSWAQPRGKQIIGDAPVLIDYDRVTGIWQSVWLEPVPDLYVDDCWSAFDLADGTLTVLAQANRETGAQLEVSVAFAGKELATGRSWMQDRREGHVRLQIPTPQLWSPTHPVLYDVEVRWRDGDRILDEVQSYAGLREWRSDGRRILLNGEPFVFRGVLDQGYFPGGWYTAPNDDDLRRDVELILAMGFNGARKHQKAEDPRWLYWADRLGLVVWSEMPSGRDFCPALLADLTHEWLEIVRRDRMHPSIMTWVPLNESWGVDGLASDLRQQEWVRALYHATRSLDPTRLVVGNDGWQHVVGDIWGIHLYLSNPSDLVTALRLVLSHPSTEVIPQRQAALPGIDVTSLPVMLTEFGGLACRAADESGDSWGYDTMADAQQLERRIAELLEAVGRVTELSGFVWTQFADVQQEVNGLLR
ncbi:MAG TPA: glycoside hydrolase family 2 TIM barrel-domain containing protein, partial [Candidatus Acidoferrales bacterium]|nr:glycoside hydrolase family 2 TIM barrel-domain containing protein [Candidatus Acidoferrales bacterium]